MNITDILIALGLTALLIEVTYLVVKLPRQNRLGKETRPIFVDTSVLIDGRILAVASSGFIGDRLIIPRSVIGELQYLADNADHDKRARARHGLDVVRQLQTMDAVTVEILQDGSKAEEGVDERLLNLARQYNGAVCTIDFNLNKVAQVENIRILNVNELAQTLRMAYLPGEKMLLELVQKGQDAHQAVGYLTDGTMVVVEHAYKHIGQTAEIEFIRSLQTAAGKMMFAKLVERPSVSQKVSPKKVVANKVTGKQPAGRAPIKPTAVYHSDNNDTRLAKREAKAAPKQQQRTSRQQPQRQATIKPASKRPKTSAQREAALINLVDNQP